jgi:hypothetical protein
MAMAPRGGPLTMLVVPARYSVLQVMFDVLQFRPAVLVSYQGDAAGAGPLLHAWNGQEWVYISMEDFSAANFSQITPSRAVLIGDENTLPQSLITASAWCPLVMSVPAVDNATLINSLGKVFRFRSSEWKWFAERYNLKLDDLNAEVRAESWYDQPFEDPGTRFPLFRAKEPASTYTSPYQAETETQVYTDPEPEPELKPKKRTRRPKTVEEDVAPADVVLFPSDHVGEAEHDADVK